MAPSKTMHGARAQLSVTDPNTGLSRIVGIFNSVSFGLSYDVRPVEILGRFNPDETVYVGQEAISVNASGWRVVDAGPHVSAGMPRLQDLLTSEYLELAIFDRQATANGQSPKPIAKIHQVRAVSYSTSYASRNLVDLNVTFIGLLVDDESVENSERPDAATLP